MQQGNVCHRLPTPERGDHGNNNLATFRSLLVHACYILLESVQWLLCRGFSSGASNGIAWRGEEGENADSEEGA